MVMQSSPLSNSMLAQHKKYRADIDGLRAVAVLSVLFFHGFPTLLPGGFIGVDIFFVMSGFLISTIIFESLLENKFSFFDFYLRRAKRIFPALIVVLIFCYFAGWNILFPNEFKALSKHIVAGALFSSNLLSFMEQGYFDVSADMKPLLHLWSLGIEEQFYIVWPLILWTCWKRKLNFLLVLLGIMLLSFGFNVVTVRTNSNAAFYMPHLRFWELLIGASLAYFSVFKSAETARLTKSYANHMACAGAVTLVLSLLLITKENAFPGWWAVLPTVAAACLIMAGPSAWINRNVLSLPVMVWFGLISFPLYLWHWPLLAFARILQNNAAGNDVIFAMLLLSVALAWLTYKFVETPIRFGKFSNSHYYSLTGILLVVAGVGVFSFIKEGKDGLPRGFLENNKISVSGSDGGDLGETEYGCGPNKKELDANFSSCISDKRETPRYVLVGDSKALALFPGLVRTSHKNGRWMLIGGNGKQGPVAPVVSDAELYQVYQKNAIAAIEKISSISEIDAIVIVASTRGIFSLKTDYSISDLESSRNFDIALAGVKKFTEKLIPLGKKIVFVVDNPTFRDPTDCLPRELKPEFFQQMVGSYKAECRIKIEEQIRLSGKYRELLKLVSEENPKLISIFDPTTRLCDTNSGYCSMTKNGRLLYGYTDHISDYAAGLVGQELNQYLTSLR